MSDTASTTRNFNKRPFGLFLAFGVAFGVIFGHIVLGISFGLLAGLIFGSGMFGSKKGDSEG